LDTITDWEKEAKAAAYAVAPLAKALGVSRQHLGRYFLRRWRFSPKSWLEQLRTADAIRLLRQGKLVKEVAAELGFDHDTDFSRAFKQRCGCGPREFCCCAAFSQPESVAECSKMLVNVPFCSLDILASIRHRE
jgi:AraC-like DNA-binding protein